jgi:hypothetical protein
LSERARYELKPRIGPLAAVASFGMLGAALAWYAERQGLNLLDVAPYRVYPPPHHVPKYLDGISLRFAMVHDVLHGRYPRHGKASRPVEELRRRSRFRENRDRA